MFVVALRVIGKEAEEKFSFGSAPIYLSWQSSRAVGLMKSVSLSPGCREDV